MVRFNFISQLVVSQRRELSTEYVKTSFRTIFANPASYQLTSNVFLCTFYYQVKFIVGHSVFYLKKHVLASRCCV
jgi:E3 ubiquitin-protein ligase DOA10